jgi:hypothetical protein
MSVPLRAVRSRPGRMLRDTLLRAQRPVARAEHPGGVRVLAPHLSATARPRRSLTAWLVTASLVVVGTVLGIVIGVLLDAWRWLR